MKIGKNFIIVGLIILIISGIVGGFILFKGNGEEQKIMPPPLEEKIEEISAESLGLTLTARGDNKAVKFEIANIRDIASVDYELSYLAKGEIPRGTFGHVEVKSGDKKIMSNYLELGTCSRSVCKYDEGVTSVKLIVKINKTDGKVLQAQKELEL